MFWVLAVLSILISTGVIMGWPIEDFLPQSLLSEVPIVGLGAGEIGLYICFGVVASVTPVHRLVHYAATVVHELGHAFVTGILGGRPKQIKIHPSGAGIATYLAPALWGRWRRALVTAAGYPAPAIAGLAGLMAARGGLGALWVLFTAAVLLLSVVLIIRNFWGFFWSAAVLAAAYLGVTTFSPEQTALLGVAMSGFLLTEAVRDSWEQVKIVRVIPESGADAEQIADWYGVSRTLTAVGMFVVVAAISGLAIATALIGHWSEITLEGSGLWDRLTRLIRDL